MAGRKKKKGKSGGGAAWLITFSDMMTLLLTFFVLLLSMASLEDVRKVRLAWTSLSGTFGIGTKSMDVLRLTESREVHEPGPMSEAEDLQPLQKLMWEDKLQDVDLLSNRFMQIISIGGDILFNPGESRITESGKRLLDRIVPVLKRADYPLLLTGHASSMRSEYGDTVLDGRKRDREALWGLSLQRSLNVYKYLLDSGLDAERVRLEAFGPYRDRHDGSTARGREKNRRVEIVLNKRHSDWQARIAAETKGESQEDGFEYKGFTFDLNGDAVPE